MRSELAPHVLDAVCRARVILVVGSRDCGKTTFVKDLANELFRQGYSVGVIDSDVGQSDIGPPTTIGFGVVRSELAGLRDADVQQLYFVGSITPRGHQSAMVLGTRKLLDRALTCGLQKILIDTTGFISGQDGRSLKQQKVQALKPDVLICLQTQMECEHILKAYALLDTPEILRLSPSKHCRRKTHPVRQNCRRESFQHYFAQAREQVLPLSEIGIFDCNLFAGRPFSPQEQDEISQLLSETHEQRTSQTSGAVVSQMYWGELIGEELFLITASALQRRQLVALKGHMPTIRCIHNSSLADFQHLLLGLLDAQGECCGVGILNSIDFSTKQAFIFTPVERKTVKAVQFGRYHFEQHETAP